MNRHPLDRSQRLQLKLKHEKKQKAKEARESRLRKKLIREELKRQETEDEINRLKQGVQPVDL